MSPTKSSSSSSSSDGPSSKEVPRRSPEIDKFVDEFLSTVCDTSRRYILELLAAPSEEERAIGVPEWRSGDIARAIGLSAATTSEHLRQLTGAGLVASRREGNMVYYSLRNHNLVNAFQDLLGALDKHHSAFIQPNIQPKNE
jgi:DNA-binding transcriptional ArsR family regulator